MDLPQLQNNPENAGAPQAISADKFTDNFLIDPKPAVTPATGTSGTDSEVRNDPPPAEEQGPSIIPDQELDPPVEEDVIKIKKWTPQERQEMADNLEMMLNCRSIWLAQGASFISGEPSAKYELSEEQMNRLAKVYAPYMRKYGNKIPDWFWLILAEGTVMWPMIRSVVADRAVNRKNARMSGSAAVHQTVNAAAARPNGRKNFSLDSDGYYLNDAVTNQRLRKEVRQAKPRPSIEELKSILEDNEISTVQALYPDWFKTGS